VKAASSSSASSSASSSEGPLDMTDAASAARNARIVRQTKATPVKVKASSSPHRGQFKHLYHIGRTYSTVAQQQRAAAADAELIGNTSLRKEKFAAADASARNTTSSSSSYDYGSHDNNREDEEKTVSPAAKKSRLVKTKQATTAAAVRALTESQKKKLNQAAAKQLAVDVAAHVRASTTRSVGSSSSSSSSAVAATRKKTRKRMVDSYTYKFICRKATGCSCKWNAETRTRSKKFYDGTKSRDTMLELAVWGKQWGLVGKSWAKRFDLHCECGGGGAFTGIFAEEDLVPRIKSAVFCECMYEDAGATSTSAAQKALVEGHTYTHETWVDAAKVMFEIPWWGTNATVLNARCEVEGCTGNARANRILSDD
jgi:hypothetical protein